MLQGRPIGAFFMYKNDYKSQYKDPRWQKKRLEILSRDNFTCQECDDDSSTLNVHHHYYTKNKPVWDYPNSALITLCEDCHKQHHTEFIDPINIKRFTRIVSLIENQREGRDISYTLGYYALMCHIIQDEPYSIPRLFFPEIDSCNRDIYEYGYSMYDIIEHCAYNNVKYKNIHKIIEDFLICGYLRTPKEIAKEWHEVMIYLKSKDNENE